MEFLPESALAEKAEDTAEETIFCTKWRTSFKILFDC